MCIKENKKYSLAFVLYIEYFRYTKISDMSNLGMAWRFELDPEHFFRIYDSQKQIAGYFDPDYGIPSNDDYEIESKQIQQMLKNSASITRGFLVLPMVRFEIFYKESMSVDTLAQQVRQALDRISEWQKFISTFGSMHSVSLSHTDQAMLSVTLEIKFIEPVPLETTSLCKSVEPILDRLQKLGLL